MLKNCCSAAVKRVLHSMLRQSMWFMNSCLLLHSVTLPTLITERRGEEGKCDRSTVEQAC